MKSAALGKSTSEVEVTNISKNGLWLLVSNKEYFLGYDEYPWFKNATVDQLLAVEMPSADHLYWAQIDVDLSVESLDCPERFPLVFKGNA